MGGQEEQWEIEVEAHFKLTAEPTAQGDSDDGLADQGSNDLEYEHGSKGCEVAVASGVTQAGRLQCAGRRYVHWLYHGLRQAVQ